MVLNSSGRDSTEARSRLHSLSQKEAGPSSPEEVPLQEPPHIVRRQHLDREPTVTRTIRKIQRNTQKTFKGV
jgi:hypothetical protein